MFAAITSLYILAMYIRQPSECRIAAQLMWSLGSLAAMKAKWR